MVSHAMEWYGNEGIPVLEASGVPIKLVDGRAVTFLSFVATGDQVLTFEESTDGAGTQSLAVIERALKFPGVGGTATLVTQAAGGSFTNADATNDAVAITVFATELSDGFNEVECTASAGTLVAIVHDLIQRRDPTKAPSVI